MNTSTKTLLCALGLVGLTSLPCQAASVETPGFLKFECWWPPLRSDTLTGTSLNTLASDPNYPATPDLTSYTVGFSTRAVFPDDSHEQHGVRLSGWIKPVTTGWYYFYLASDDASQLWISTDSTEALLDLRAEEFGCCHGFLEPGNAQTSEPQYLVAGQKYAVQVVLKEGTGGDYVYVAMQSTNGTTPAASLKALASTMLSSMADPAGASLSISQQPASKTTPENATNVSFSIATTATTPYGKYTSSTTLTPSQGGAVPLGTKSQLDTFYQWFTNGVEVPGANSSTYTIAWPKKAQDGLKVKCYTAVPGIPLYSSEATLTVTDDTIAPTVVSAKADAGFVTVVLKFSEPVPDSALLASHYAIDQGVSVTNVTRVDLQTVKLGTTRMADGKVYTLTINGVQDTATPANTIAANTQIQFKSFVFVPGVVVHKKFTGFSDSTGTSIANLFNDSRWPDNPDRKELMSYYEYPSGASGRDATADPTRMYIDVLEGYFVPPSSGNYVFFISFADYCWLYLSTDEDPANKQQVLAVSGWSDPRNWLSSHDYAVSQARSDQCNNTQWPNGNTITLQGNKRYYLLAAHYDASWAGGDWFASTYKAEAAGDPANGSAPTLTGNAIGAYLDPSVGSVTFSLQPSNQTAYAGNKASFAGVASGSSSYTTVVTYQWQAAPKSSSTFTNIPGATSTNYTTPYLVAGNDGTQYRLIAMAAPVSATSQVATLTVLVDNIAPTVVKASTDMYWTNVTLVFSEPVTDTALALARYQMNNGATISAATRVDTLTIRLTTSKLTPNSTYILTINGIQDVAGNTIATNTQVEIRSMVLLSGAVLHKKYNNIDNGVGSSPAGLFSDARYPNNFDRQDLMLRWEYPADGAGRVAADPARNYFDTIEGYFIPAVTTNYVFYLAGADRFWFYLSTDEDPANMHLVAAQPNGWTNPRNWITGQGGTDMTSQRTDTYVSSEWPDGGANINLEAGKKYYMLSIHHDPSWCGADDFGVTFKYQGEVDPVDGAAPRLVGGLIAYYFDPSGATVTFTQQPTNTSVTQGRSALFTAAATGSSVYGSTVYFQWQSAPAGSSTWTDIAGATSASYRTPLTSLSDSGKQYRVVASVPPYSLASSAAALTVTADTTPPVVTVGAMQDATAGVVDVGVGFDETVDEASATLLSNYSVSPGTITGLTWQTNRFTANSQNPLVMSRKQTALLKVTGLTTSGTLTVKNVKDIFNNAITSVSVPFTVDTKMKWGVVGGHEFQTNALGAWNAVVPVTANGFDIYSDGVGAWGQYDEATLVYEQVTGDFDKKLRVAYQDGSSQWARAGIIAKEFLGFGDDRTTQATTAIRYQKCLVYPVGAVLQGPGTAGSASWSLNRRLTTGGATDGGSVTGTNAVPSYPNAWCRLQRVGQVFNMYRSDDGVNWALLGSTSWETNPMPATLYVGPEFAPEIYNITLPVDRGTFLAQIRDYGDYVSAFNPQLKIAMGSNGKVTITWSSGTLVSSPTVNGTYSTVSGATSPYEVTPTATTFYRVKQ